jgi:hypothetical protein
MGDTVVTVRFTDIGQARRALRMLKLMGSEGQLRVRAATLAFEEIGRDLEPGITLVIAEVEDPDPDVLDSALDALGGYAATRAAAAYSADLRAA